MPALFDLPIELFEAVLDLLTVPECSVLSRTCTTLSNILQRRIYHTIEWFWEYGRTAPPFHLLLRTLLSNPRRADLVKVARFRGTGIINLLPGDCREAEFWTGPCPDAPYKSAAFMFSKSVKDAFSQARIFGQVRNLIAQIAPNSPIHCTSHFLQGNTDVIVGLLLTQLHSLEHLSLGFGFIHQATFIPKSFRYLIDVSQKSPVFSCLRTLDLGKDGPNSMNWSILDFDLFRLWLYLPRIEKINVMVLEPIIFAWPSPSMVPRSTSLTSLILRKTTISVATLDGILACTPSLKCLLYDCALFVCFDEPHWALWNVLDEYEYTDRSKIARKREEVTLEARRLGRALCRVKESLENLDLNIAFQPCTTSRSEDCAYIIGRVAGIEKFTKLKRLDISWDLLFGCLDSKVMEHLESDYAMKEAEFCNTDTSTENIWMHVLPTQLEELCLLDHRDEKQEYYPVTRLDYAWLTTQLVAARADHFRKLRRIEFRFPQRWGSKRSIVRHEIGDALEQICTDANIDSRAFCAYGPPPGY